MLLTECPFAYRQGIELWWASLPPEQATSYIASRYQRYCGKLVLKGDTSGLMLWRRMMILLRSFSVRTFLELRKWDFRVQSPRCSCSSVVTTFLLPGSFGFTPPSLSLFFLLGFYLLQFPAEIYQLACNKPDQLETNELCFLLMKSHHFLFVFFFWDLWVSK